jgi:hypothetical protein
VDAALRIGARATYFVHMAHEVMHAPVDAGLPEGMHLAHDGLTLGGLGDAEERAFAHDAARMSAAIRRVDPGARAAPAARADRFDEG